MAASDYEFLLTRDEIIEQAFIKVGALVEGEQLSANELDIGIKRLNLIVKDWQNSGIYLWQEFTEEQPLSVGTERYQIPTDPPAHCVEKAYLRQEIGVVQTDILLEYFSYRKFLEIYDKQSSGTPYCWTVDTANQEVILFPVPDARDTIILHCIKVLKDFATADGSGDFPVNWQRALFYALADDIGEDYALSGTEQRKLQIKAASTFANAKNNERDVSDREFVKGAY